MIDSNPDPTLIVAHIIDPIGNRLAQFLIGKIMNQGLFRSCLGTPLLAVVAEVSDQFLLLSVHGNDRATLFQEPLGLSIDVLKLSVAIRMIAPFDGYCLADCIPFDGVDQPPFDLQCGSLVVAILPPACACSYTSNAKQIPGPLGWWVPPTPPMPGEAWARPGTCVRLRSSGLAPPPSLSRDLYSTHASRYAPWSETNQWLARP